MNQILTEKEQQQVAAVKKVLQDSGIAVLSIRKRTGIENKFVFETDFLSEKSLSAIHQRFNVGAVTAEHNYGVRNHPLDDIRLRIDITVINP